ncbi:MAG: signal peptide peptidase SppA [Actinobacteria bacterium]|nr:signal peptide peptidase SppA [Actinomycetota bacterium]
MRPDRALQALTMAAATLWLAIVVTMVVAALATPLAALIVLGVTVLASIAWKVSQKRVRRGTVIEIDLDGGVVEHPMTRPIDRLLSPGATVLRDMVDALHRAAVDDRVVGVVARLGNGSLGLAQAQEIRGAVARFKAEGKRTVAYAESFGETGLATIDYYLAAGFAEINLQPVGGLSIQGVVVRTPFLRSLFDKIGVIPDLDHRREYKAAKYLLTETDYVAPHREATTAILTEQMDQMVAGISEGRGIPPERVREMIDRAPLTAAEALETGLVDRLSYRDEAYAAAGRDKPRYLHAAKYLKRAGRPQRSGPRVALIYGTGPIARGRSRFDPMGRAPSFGADEVAEAFREARDDRRVKAVVFRVDSPGGSAVASEVVRHEVARAREAGKPVVVSMGDVAGSGGYFVATDADRIVAQPGTITGSIGVVMGKLATAAAWSRVGVDWRSLGIGDNVTFSVPDQPFTDGERARLEHELDRLYLDFKERVAAGRGLALDQVEEVARGRIWTGEQARELGLVDDLGGVDRAVELAKELLGMSADRSVSLVVYPRGRAMGLTRGRESSEPIAIWGWVLHGLDRLLGRVADPVLELRMPDR